MVELAVFAFGRRPAYPSVILIEEVAVASAVDLGDGQPFLLQIIEIFEEEQPRSLLDVVELGGASVLLTEDIIDVAKSLFEHESPKAPISLPSLS